MLINMKTNSKRTELAGAYSYGYRGVDKLTGGLRPGELTLVGARVGMGKTAFAFNLVAQLVEQGLSVTYLSTDGFIQPGKEHPALRLLHLLSGGISAHKIDETYWINMRALCEKLAKTGFVCREKTMLYDFLTPNGYKCRIDPIGDYDEVRKIAYTDRPDVLIIDGLQLVKYSDWDDPGNMILYFAFWNHLKDLAQELSIPILVLAKWPRCCEEREDKRPSLEDFDKFDADADMFDAILFLYREAYYEVESENTDTMEVIVAKSPVTENMVCNLQYDRLTCLIGKDQPK